MTMICLPERLTYESLNQLLPALLVSAEPDICFDWNEVLWVDIPEVIELLCWSSHLIDKKHRVAWQFKQSYAVSQTLEDLRYNVGIAIGQERVRRYLGRIENLYVRALNGTLFPGQRSKEIAAIQQELKGFSFQTGSLMARWLRDEAVPFEVMDVHAYLSRYQIFDRAREIGVEVRPAPESLVLSQLQASSSRTFPVRPFASRPTIEELIESFDVDRLTKILGDHAAIDCVSGGALASVIVAELGRNIADHAGAEFAWLCTRIVTKENLTGQATSDPALRPFVEAHEGFLEVVICDTGCGITCGLGDVLAADTRQSVLSRYAASAMLQEYETYQLIDYAFDRLSSTKRNIGQLLHLTSQGNGHLRVVPSGLYWVWNTVRTHGGVISVRTKDVSAWYDLTHNNKNGVKRSRERALIEFERRPVSLPGTMLRICLPLRHTAREVQRASYWAQAEKIPSSAENPKYHVAWAGEVARRLRPASKKAKRVASRSQAELPGVPALDDDLAQLGHLQREHAYLNDGDVLLLDLCGVRRDWAARSAAVIASFFLEMNYTSPVGRSTVALWNVPNTLIDIFDEAIRDAEVQYAQLRRFRRPAVLITDTGQMRIYCAWPRAERLLQRFQNQSELHLRELSESTLTEDEVTELRALLEENSHLFTFEAHDRVRFRMWPIAARAAAWEAGLKWLGERVDADLDRRGAHRVSPGRVYRLPSTASLVRDFYQFSAILADTEVAARIAWMLAQCVRALAKRGTSQPWIITVTRSTLSLTHRLTDDLLKPIAQAEWNVLAESTVEDLAKKGRERHARGTAILITDVIASGSLCRDVAQALPELEWVGTLSIVDTRPGEESRCSEEVDFGISAFATAPVATGPVYSLTKRSVPPVDPASVSARVIIPIDKVNVCPVQPATTPTEPKIWASIQAHPEVFRVGHIHSVGDYHHYVYFVNTKSLLSCAHTRGGNVLDMLVEVIREDLETAGYDPDRTIIIHPPRGTSEAEYIARAVAHETSALYRQPLHRDLRDGQWLFSPYLDHGLRVENHTAVVIDDGSNTGETFVSLITTALATKPRRVLAYGVLTRMPEHKADFFHALRVLSTREPSVREVETRVRFAVRLSIPVYTSRNCPVCRLRRGLSEVRRYCALLERFARSLSDDLRSVSTEETDPGLPWRYHDRTTVGRLREALGPVDIHASHTTEAASAMNEANRDANLSYRVAMRRKCLIRQNHRSMRLR